MSIYFRIQPSSLNINGHFSECSDGSVADGLHVFSQPHETFYAIWNNGLIEAYGDEILVIEASESWDNGDLEGVCIDPDDAKIIKRYSWSEWAEIYKHVIRLTFSEANFDTTDFSDEGFKYFYELKEYELEDWNEEILSYVTA